MFLWVGDTILKVSSCMLYSLLAALQYWRSTHGALHQDHRSFKPSALWLPAYKVTWENAQDAALKRTTCRFLLLQEQGSFGQPCGMPL